MMPERDRRAAKSALVRTAPAPASCSIESCAKMVVVEQPSEGAPSMGKSITDLSSVTTVGVDLAKHVFQVHGIDASGRVIIAKALRRKDVLAFFAQLPQCLVGMEACSSAHHWARELIKLGHDARMMPPAYVKPYVRRQKNDAADGRRHLRSGDKAFDALCRRAHAGEPGGAHASQGARNAGGATHATDQRASWAS